MPHRYVLERVIPGVVGPSLCWLMLNPSTADAQNDDPTIRKVVGFTSRAGYGSAVVVNLFAWRATDPRELKRHLLLRRRAVDERKNREAIADAVSTTSAVVCAWGATPWAAEQAARVVEWLRATPRTPLLCLGLTKSGAPRHPLMLSYEGHPFVPFAPRAASRSRARAVG